MTREEALAMLRLIAQLAQACYQEPEEPAASTNGHGTVEAVVAAQP